MLLKLDRVIYALDGARWSGGFAVRPAKRVLCGEMQ